MDGGTPDIEDVAVWQEELGVTFPALADTDGSFYDSYGRGTDVFVFGGRK